MRAAPDFAEWLRDRRNKRRIPHRLDERGYVAVRNDNAKDGLWVINGKRQVIYAKREVCWRDQLAATEQLVAISTPKGINQMRSVKSVIRQRTPLPLIQVTMGKLFIF